MPNRIIWTEIVKYYLSNTNMASTSRQEREMREKYNKIKAQPDISPLERLRAHLLSEGGSCSLKNLHR